MAIIESASVGDVYQVRIRGEIEGQETNNIWYFSSASGTSDVETHLILVIATCFITHLIPALSHLWQMKDIVWKKVYPTLGVENITTPTGTLVGGVSTDALPSFVSIVTSIRTAFGGRSKRGRFYLAGAPEAATVGSNLDTGGALWTAYLAFLNCIVTNFVVGDPPGADSFQMQVFSRKVGGTHFPVTNPAAFTPMKSLKPVQALGTTRSRKVGRGS